MTWLCLECGSSNPISNPICGSRNCQQLRLRDLDAGDATAPATPASKSATAPATDVASPVAGRSSGSKTSTKKQRHSYPEAFELFWSEYPLHKDKLAALRAWKRATDAGADADELREAAVRYRNDPQRTSQYTKHAERWINAGGYLDEAGPATAPDRSPASVKTQAEIDAEWERQRAEEDARIEAIRRQEAMA